MKIITLLVALVSAGCSTEIDTSNLLSIDNYTDWPSIEISGDVAGHGNTRRVVFINDVASTFDGSGPYLPGAALVKEVRDKDNDALLYLAIMRKLKRQQADVDSSYVNRGWIYTQADKLGDPETTADYCFSACHTQAPWDGTFLRY